MTTIVSSANLNGDGNSFTLANGSQAGRCVVIIGAQERTPANIENFTFDGVLADPTKVSFQTTPDGNKRSIVVVFEDSDLPTAAGNYLVSRNTSTAGGLDHVVIELSGAGSFSFSSGNATAAASVTPTNIDFSPATINDLFIVSLAQNIESGANISVTNGTALRASLDYFLGHKLNTDDTDVASVTVRDDAELAWAGVKLTAGAVAPTLRKGSQFTVETTLAGTVTSATLNGAAITVDSHVGTTVTLTDSDGSITTSGEYALVLTDDAVATETITVQVNVYGVAPSNNPLQKDGAALASLTDVEVRISAGATLAGSQLFYSGTATTDASGNLGNIDLSSTNAADADPVLLSIRTAAGDSIIASETVGII